uniref:Immunoglobulin domain-containing protein n=1 Tax=Jaculus jaculus TaxID=51337 RepID=A0A8C5P3K1_JACJA
CSSVQNPTGPKLVIGQEKGSLIVKCHYGSSWKTYTKYWCQGPDWKSCRTLVTTNSEQLVKKDRVSIKDNQKSLVFTVTMENLRRSDAGTYWCGIERTGVDPGFEVNVVIDPGKNSSLMYHTAVDLLWPPYARTVGTPACTRTSPLNSVFFQILVFLELPLLLSMLSAVLWVNRPQTCSENQ